MTAARSETGSARTRLRAFIRERGDQVSGTQTFFVSREDDLGLESRTITAWEDGTITTAAIIGQHIWRSDNITEAECEQLLSEFGQTTRTLPRGVIRMVVAVTAWTVIIANPALHTRAGWWVAVIASLVGLWGFADLAESREKVPS